MMATEVNRALALQGPGEIAEITGESFGEPSPEEVCVRVERISLCGSDYGLFHGRYGGPAAYPIRFGHEWSGHVEAVGKAVSRVSIGDAVTGDCSKWCGRCPACAVDRNLCQAISKFGITENGMSQRLVTVHQRYLYRDRYCLGMDLLAMVEPFAVALHAIRRAGVAGIEPKGGAVIVGAGAIGLGVYLLLREHFGWRQLCLLEDTPQKRELLPRLIPGIDDVSPAPISVGSENDYARLYKDGPPVVFETSGSAAGLSTAMTIVRAGGTVAMLGIVAEPVVLRLATIKALRLVGSMGGTGAFDEVLAFFSSHRQLLHPLITGRYPAHAAAQAFIDGSERSTHIKVQIDLSDWSER